MPNEDRGRPLKRQHPRRIGQKGTRIRRDVTTLAWSQMSLSTSHLDRTGRYVLLGG